MKKLLSLLLSAAMLVSLAAGLSLTASAAAAAPAESVVTEMTVAENTVFVYAPKSELTVSSTCTAPCFIVYGSGAYTAQSAKAEAEYEKLGQLVDKITPKFIKKRMQKKRDEQENAREE